MPRPEKQRIVNTPPLFSSFKPTGVTRTSLKKITLSLDEYEAIRLADKLGMDHSEAAELMEISRSTFTRLIEKSRSKMAEFIISGAELQIAGGNIHFRGNIIRCEDCGHMFKTDFEIQIRSCPSCGSEMLSDMAGGFGHGQCCRRGRGHGNGGGRR